MTHRIDKNVSYKSITFYLKDSKSGKPFVMDINKELDSPFFYTGKNHEENVDLTVTYVIDSLDFKIKKQETWMQLKKKKHIWFN